MADRVWTVCRRKSAVAQARKPHANGFLVSHTSAEEALERRRYREAVNEQEAAEGQAGSHQGKYDVDSFPTYRPVEPIAASCDAGLTQLLRCTWQS